MVTSRLLGRYVLIRGTAPVTVILLLLVVRFVIAVDLFQSLAMPQQSAERRCQLYSLANESKRSLRFGMMLAMGMYL
jgi:hypothetical protein